MSDEIPSHIHVAFVGDGAIVLDTRADRYRRIRPDLARALGRLLQSEYDDRDTSGLADASSKDAEQRSIRTLRTYGFLMEGTPGQPRYTPARPAHLRRSALDARRCYPARADPSLASTFGALLAARASLRFRGLDRTLFAVRARKRADARDDPTGAVGRAQSFADARLWFPERPRCLPDSIALHALLARDRLSCRLVIGVRDQPFAAHSWVEAGDTVLNDTVEHVAELTPILTL